MARLPAIVYNAGMRWLASTLAACTLASCAGHTERLSFRNAAEAHQGMRPDGVHWSTALEGVLEVPRRGVARRRYELRITLEHPVDAGTIWEPVELGRTTVRDDEGGTFPAVAVLVSTSESKRSRKKKTPPAAAKAAIRHYRVDYTVDLPYRFEGIGRAAVTWKLRAPGKPPIAIESSFVR